jgi:flavodoxin
MSGKLVAYFSASGVTKLVAERLATAAGADLYEIRPKRPYSRADLDWTNERSRRSVEMRDPSFRPPLADLDADVASRGVVFLGFPIWWYVAPTIINTFLESYDFSGKIIAPFATSGGSGIGDAVAGLRGSVHPSAAIKEGEVFTDAQTSESLAAWAASLGL